MVLLYVNNRCYISEKERMHFWLWEDWRLGLVFNFAANGTNLNYSTRLSIQIFSLLIINRL